ncbi:hypothetical protein [Corynebacterium dentalis]|uniref:hypothetical protein n=1 Tax=Corynebacterium dentalis TaxID=2014528 RepID=UPI0028A0CA8B|nr:hypothetical protein [Corynebacterium dentalis]
MTAPEDLRLPDIGLAVCERWKDIGSSADLLSWASLAGRLGFDEIVCQGIEQAVIIPRAVRIECVVTGKPDWENVYRSVHRLLDEGWGVTVLAPLASLGTAHESLSGLAATLQGWWIRNDHELRFSTEEIA